MGVDEWELLDCHEEDDGKLSSAKRGVDLKRVFDSVPDEQHRITCGGPCDDEEGEVGKMPREIGAEDTVFQVSGQKTIGDMKNDTGRLCSEGIAGESDVDEEVQGKKEGVNSRRMNMAMEKSGVESKSGLTVQKWGRGAMCWFGIAVAATICSLLLGSHDQGGANKQHRKNQICP